MPQIQSPIHLKLRNLMLLLSSSLVVLAGASHVPSLSVLGGHFSSWGDGVFFSQIFLVLPTLFLAFASPIAGRLIDRKGRKAVLVGACFVVGASGVAGFFAKTPATVLLSRVGVGLGLAGSMSASTTLIADYFRGEARHRFLGDQGSFMAFSGVFLLIIGGFLSQWGWRPPFLMYLVAVILGVLALLLISDPDHPLGRAQESADDPIRVPVFLLTCLYATGFAGSVIFYVIPAQISYFMKSISLSSSFKTAMAYAGATLLSGLVAMQYNVAKRHLRFGTIFFVNFSLVGAGYVMMSRATSFNEIAMGLCVACVGFGWQYVNLNSWVVARVPEYWRGRAVGGLNSAVFLGQFMSPFLSNPVNKKYGLAAPFFIAGAAALVMAATFLVYDRLNARKGGIGG